eukprot:124871-Alexandrium_andersonii.AAC.1
MPSTVGAAPIKEAGASCLGWGVAPVLLLAHVVLEAGNAFQKGPDLLDAVHVRLGVGHCRAVVRKERERGRR